MSNSSGDNPAEPNLTPLLDLVFQLIAFFMLVINFRTILIDHEVQLPVSGSARPAIADVSDTPLIINVRATGELTVVSSDSPEPQPITAEEFFQREALKRRELFDDAKDSPSDDGEIETVVVIRADAATAFTTLNETLECCRRNGFHRIALKTLKQDQPYAR
jgi:biopolymer transport protein ExbD